MAGSWQKLICCVAEIVSRAIKMYQQPLGLGKCFIWIWLCDCSQIQRLEVYARLALKNTKVNSTETGGSKNDIKSFRWYLRNVKV